jgi:hypothetical protein
MVLAFMLAQLLSPTGPTLTVREGRRGRLSPDERQVCAERQLQNRFCLSAQNLIRTLCLLIPGGEKFLAVPEGERIPR